MPKKSLQFYVFWLKYLDKKRLLLNAYKLFMLFYALKLSLKNKKIILKNSMMKVFIL